MTTEWIVAAYVPLLPTLSRRIHSTNVHNPYAMPHGDGYYVYETTNPDPRQVLYIYGWMTAVLVLVFGFSALGERLAKIVGNEDRAAATWLAALVVICAMPWILRRWTKQRLTRRWLREAAGLGPPGL